MTDNDNVAAYLYEQFVDGQWYEQAKPEHPSVSFPDHKYRNVRPLVEKHD